MLEHTLKPIHKFHAVEANNHTWDLIVIDRTPDQDEEMLTSAHAAAYHWRQVGSELHRARATMLLAQVHALVGLGSTAWIYAEEMRAFFLAQTTTPDWELAFTHAIHAHAASVAGQSKAHRESYQLAEATLTAIENEDDRMVVQATFDLVPNPRK